MADIASTRAKIAAFDAEVAALAPAPPAPVVVAGMTVTPNNLPIGGGQVTANANVSGAFNLVKLSVDGVDKGAVTLPYTFTLT